MPEDTVQWTTSADLVTGSSPASTALSQAVVPANPWPELEAAGLLAAGSVTPGPIGTVLGGRARAGVLDALKRLEAGGASFERQRRFWIPFLMSKYVPLTAEGLAAEIETQPSPFEKRYNVGLPPREHQAMTSLQDVQALDAIRGLPEAAVGPHASGLVAMRALEGAGWSFSRGYYYDDEPGGVGDAYSGFRAMAGEGAALYLKSPQGQSYEVRNLDDVVSLDFFHGTGADHGLKSPQVARELQQLAGHGLKTLDNRGEECDPWAVYRGLESSSDTVRVGRGGQIFVPVESKDLGNIQGLESRLDEASRLCGLLAPGLEAAELERGQQYFLEELEKPCPFVSAEIRAVAIAELLKAGASHDGRDLAKHACEDLRHLIEHSKDEVSFALLANRFLGVLAEQGREAAQRVWETMDGDLRALAGSDAERAHVEELFGRLLEGTRSISATVEGLDLVRISVGSETEGDRVRVFLDIASSESERTLGNAARDYRAVLVHRLPSESVVEAGCRMGTILRTLSYNRQQDRAAEVFAVVQAAARDGLAGGASADDLVGRFTQALAIHGDADKALQAVASGAAESGLPCGHSVEQDDGFVTIGGIRIPRSKG